MARSITLTREPQTTFTVGTQMCFRFRVTASDAVDMANEIFLFRLRPLVPGAEDRVAEFLSICSPVDLEDYPADEPEEDASPAFFRLASIDLLVRSQTLAEQLWTNIQAAVAVLIEALNASDDLDAGEVVTIP